MRPGMTTIQSVARDAHEDIFASPGALAFANEHSGSAAPPAPITSCRGGSQALLVFVTGPLSWPTPPGHADDDSVRFPLEGSPRAWPREPVGKAGSERLRVGRHPMCATPGPAIDQEGGHGISTIG